MPSHSIYKVVSIISTTKNNKWTHRLKRLWDSESLSDKSYIDVPTAGAVSRTYITCTISNYTICWAHIREHCHKYRIYKRQNYIEFSCHRRTIHCPQEYMQERILYFVQPNCLMHLLLGRIIFAPFILFSADKKQGMWV